MVVLNKYTPIMDKRFVDIIGLIKESRSNILKTISTELINLYWSVGKYISQKIEQQSGATL